MFLSLLYLALPNLIFVIGWLRWYVALPAALIVALPLRRPPRGLSGTTTAPQVAFVALLALMTVAISGAGGFGFQNSDWLKHDALLKDLIERTWPVTYEIDGHAYPLVYYVAYLLPAALGGKLLGWGMANCLVFVWTVLGLCLAMLWAVLLMRPASRLAPLVFLTFSGLDVVGLWCVEPWRFGQPWNDIEWWAGQWLYGANIRLIFWAPNQALAGWITTGIVMHALSSRAGHRRVLYAFALTALWSPFVCLGLAPFVVLDVLLRRSSAAAWPRLSLGDVCGVLLLALMGFYFCSRLFPLALGQEHAPTPNGWIFTQPRDRTSAVLILSTGAVFVALESGVYAAVLAAVIPSSDRRHRVLLVVAAGLLAMLPSYRYGYNNDLAMRASIPALFVLCVLVGRCFLERDAPSKWRFVLFLLLAVGAVTPFVEVRGNLRAIAARGTVVHRSTAENVSDLYALFRRRYPHTGMMRNYVGDGGAPFFAYVANRRDGNAAFR